MNKNQFEGAYTDRFFIALARVPKESVGAAQFFFLRLPATNSPPKTDVLSIALLLNDNTNFQYIFWLFSRNAGPGAYLYLICNTISPYQGKTIFIKPQCKVSVTLNLTCHFMFEDDWGEMKTNELARHVIIIKAKFRGRGGSSYFMKFKLCMMEMIMYTFCVISCCRYLKWYSGVY